MEFVNHPSYYGGAGNPYEVIKVIEAWGLDNNFDLATVIKYLARQGKKPQNPAIQDLEKAEWYLTHEIEKVKEKQKKEASDMWRFYRGFGSDIWPTLEGSADKVHIKSTFDNENSKCKTTNVNENVKKDSDESNKHCCCDTDDLLKHFKDYSDHLEDCDEEELGEEDFEDCDGYNSDEVEIDAEELQEAINTICDFLHISCLSNEVIACIAVRETKNGAKVEIEFKNDIGSHGGKHAIRS